ncbi:MAG TPA: metallophosphoesterase [Syntrophales bacterium]|nr:metallophosphoesterase [Syntrophales bacterium]HOL60150.1 metallophosphoesterase [Syntrophales bacterium]HPO36258.1 metallophosphoesterase [Syntrophales bacterium]
MKLFLLVYLSIYSVMHGYFYLRLRGAVVLSTGGNLLLLAFLFLMILAPIFVRVTEHRGWEAVASLFAYVGYTWMGFLFLFVVSALLVDIIRLALAPLGWKTSMRIGFFLPFIVAACAYLYGYYEAWHIRVERVLIESPRIPKEAGTIRLLQVSDIHMGLMVQGKRLERIVEKVKALNPDVLVSTGDLVDGQMNSLTQAVAWWRKVNPPYGKYAVTGNHEFFAGIDHALAVTREAGFRVLRGEAVKPIAGLCLVGVDDPMGKYLGREGATDPPPRGQEFTVLLKHQPFVSRKQLGLFDLQISGHTHAGQIFPFSLITALYFKRQAGFFRLEDGAMLYISRGTGTWGPPIRIFSPPEITCFELRYGLAPGVVRF